MRKLKNYKPTKFKAKDSYYDKEYADFVMSFFGKKLLQKSITIRNTLTLPLPLSKVCATPKALGRVNGLSLWTGRNRLFVTFLVF